MANNSDKAFETDDGFTIKDGPFITGGTSSPVGLDAPVGTIYIQTATDGVKLWKHFTTNVADWKTLNEEVFGISPPGIVITHNGTMSRNQLVGYSNLANNAFVVGFKSKLAKITTVNKRTGADYALDFFDGESDGGNNNGFFRHTVVNNSPLVADVTGSPTFNAGDRLGIYYRDTGLNASDLNLTLFFEAVE